MGTPEFIFVKRLSSSRDWVRKQQGIALVLQVVQGSGAVFGYYIAFLGEEPTRGEMWDHVGTNVWFCGIENTRPCTPSEIASAERITKLIKNVKHAKWGMKK